MKPASFRKFLYKILCGVLLGVSIIAPGVSSSVIAVIMGIYDDLLNIVSDPFKNLKRNIIYLLPIGIGAVICMAVFIQVLNWLFGQYPIPAYFLFIGLIAGSLPTVFKEANTDGLKKRYIVAILSTFAFAVTIGLLADSAVTKTAEISNWLYYAFCGALAGISSMIPGMSISMILMILGVYEPMLGSSSSLIKMTVGMERITGIADFIMIPVVLCFIVGMVLFSKFTKFIFRRFHNFAYFMVFGFMLGSIINIFPGLPGDVLTWVYSAAAILLGLFISALFQKLGKQFNRVELSEYI